MCCHQCCSPIDPATVARRQQTAVSPTLSRPFIQFNYVRIDHPSKTSINIDGSLGMSPGDHPNMSLHRASTIAHGGMMLSSELAAGSASSQSSLGGLRHSHSMHGHVDTGCNDSNIPKREHMSKKICQSLRRKLSAINKLRVKWQGAGSTKPEPKDTDSTVVSDYGEVSHNPVATVPTPEMDAHHYSPRSAGPQAYPCGPTVMQAELPVNSLYELPSIQSTIASMDSENDGPPRDKLPEAHARSFPHSQASMVSALSSYWNSTGSERHSSWQVSQCSDVSGITPQTSLSETDWVHGGPAYRPTDDSVASPTHPLSLDTHLAVPRASFVDGPLTDSPTSGDLADFPLQQQMAELDAATGPWSVSQELAAGAEVLPSYSDQPQQPAEPEELMLSSPGVFDLPQAPNTDLNLIDEPLPEYATWEPAIDTTTSIPSQFLDACRLYADSIPDKSHSNVRTVLEAAFEVTKFYYLKRADVSGRTLTKTLRRVWSEPPTIEAALRGMNCLLTYDAGPTVCELVSLAFLSLSLVGLSLDTEDLAIVVRILHRQAKSWSSLILTKHERTWFADFVDDLWLLAEQDQSHSTDEAVAPEPSLGVDMKSLLLMDTNEFVTQVAQIFIHFATDIKAQVGSVSFPSIQKTLEEDYRKMLGTLPHPTYSLASSPLLDLFEVAGGVPLPDTYEALESFIHPEHSQDRSGARTPSQVLAKRILRILGGRYVGRVAIWLYHQFLASAEQVVSHPQSLALISLEPLLPIEAQLLMANEPPEMRKDLPQPSLPPTGQMAKPCGKIKSKALPKEKQARKRKSSGDSELVETFRCDEHDINFTGEYAENSYKRHMRRTKQHGSVHFKCHICHTSQPRVDHFKTHMRKWHGLNVRGRSGDYTFEEIDDDCALAELEASAGVAADELAYLPASIR